MHLPSRQAPRHPLISLVSILGFALTSSCATSTGSDGFSRGFASSPVGQDGYYTRFSAGFTTSSETVLNYWLYNCAILVLSRGYDGFEVEQSTDATRPDVRPGLAGTYLAVELIP